MSDIIIYGRGKTGQSLQKMLKAEGKQAVFYDDVSGFDGDYDFSKNCLVILSPGVKPNSKGVIAAQAKGAKVMGELDYCFERCRGRCVSITGTNGKTTVCEMIYHILKSCNVKSRLLGNGGIPFSSEVLDVQADEIVVLESSSFQLLNATDFVPYISVFSNFACDHLDYHGSMENYALAKCNNFIHQKEGYAIFNADDDNTVALSEQCVSAKLFYSTACQNANCYFDGEGVALNLFGRKERVPAPFLRDYAKHNLSNALAATLVARLLNVSLEAIVKAMSTYKLLPHRMESVATIDNVSFVDDSKATNVHATVSALKNYSEPLALILGGSDKGEKFDGIFSALGKNVVAVAASGDTAGAISACGSKYGVDVRIFDDIAQATYYCQKMIANLGGGVVLMSNACASFDKFRGYEERGRYFRSIVEGLSGGKKEY